MDSLDPGKDQDLDYTIDIWRDIFDDMRTKTFLGSSESHNIRSDLSLYNNIRDHDSFLFFLRPPAKGEEGGVSQLVARRARLQKKFHDNNVCWERGKG